MTPKLLLLAGFIEAVIIFNLCGTWEQMSNHRSAADGKRKNQIIKHLWVPIHVTLWACDDPTVPQLSEQLEFRSGDLGAATGTGDVCLSPSSQGAEL